MKREGTTTIKAVYEPILYVSDLAEEKIEFIIKKMGGLEIGWMGYVFKTEGGDYVLTDIEIPFQSVSAGTCEIRPEQWNERSVAIYMEDEEKYNMLRLWGHSHHSMGVSPSGQDDAQFNSFINQFKDETINPYFIRMIANNKGVTKVDVYENDTNLIFSNIEVTKVPKYNAEFYDELEAQLRASYELMEEKNKRENKANFQSPTKAQSTSVGTVSTTKNFGTSGGSEGSRMPRTLLLDDRKNMLKALFLESPVENEVDDILSEFEYKHPLAMSTSSAVPEEPFTAANVLNVYGTMNVDIVDNENVYTNQLYKVATWMGKTYRTVMADTFLTGVEDAFFEDPKVKEIDIIQYLIMQSYEDVATIYDEAKLTAKFSVLNTIGLPEDIYDTPFMHYMSFAYFLEGLYTFGAFNQVFKKKKMKDAMYSEIHEAFKYVPVSVKNKAVSSVIANIKQQKIEA